MARVADPTGIPKKRERSQNEFEMGWSSIPWGNRDLG